MKRLLQAAIVTAVLLTAGSEGNAQSTWNYQPPAAYQLNRFYYWPYQYYPHNYWPTQSPRWPEAQGMPYMPAPAYQAYPAVLDQNWRYEFMSHQRFHRGFHFWLDQF